MVSFSFDVEEDSDDPDDPEDPVDPVDPDDPDDRLVSIVVRSYVKLKKANDTTTISKKSDEKILPGTFSF